MKKARNLQRKTSGRRAWQTTHPLVDLGFSRFENYSPPAERLIFPPTEMGVGTSLRTFTISIVQHGIPLSSRRRHLPHNRERICAYNAMENQQDKLDYAANGTFNTVSDAQYKTLSAKYTQVMNTAHNKWDNDL